MSKISDNKIGWIVALLLAALLAVVFAVWPPFAKAEQVSPPFLIVLEDESIAKESDGDAITLAPETKVEACSAAGVVMEYDLATRTFHYPAPCNKLFTDGFE